VLAGMMAGMLRDAAADTLSSFLPQGWSMREVTPFPPFSRRGGAFVK
jgi:hypothetical protein